jgi:hypothetical protein
MDHQITLTLTEEEALALLSVTMLSAAKLDPNAESALNKLAEYCRNHLAISGNATEIESLSQVG